MEGLVEVVALRLTNQEEVEEAVEVVALPQINQEAEEILGEVVVVNLDLHVLVLMEIEEAAVEVAVVKEFLIVMGMMNGLVEVVIILFLYM